MARLSPSVSSFVRSLLSTIPALATPLVALATPLEINNPSFESPVLNAGMFATSSPPDGWASYGSSLDFNARTVGALNPRETTLYPGGAPDDRNVGVVFLQPSLGQEAGLQQTLSATLQPNTRYTLTVAVGNIGNDSNYPHNLFDFTGFPGYRIELLAGSTVIGSDNNSLLPLEGQFLTSSIEAVIGESHPEFGSPLTLRLINLDGPSGTEVNFDDVRLDADSTDDCPSPPLPSCEQSASGKGVLKLSRKVSDPAKSTVNWTWKSGGSSPSAFGNPLGSSDYRICIYDGADQTILDLPARAGETCGDRPCWKDSTSGFAYKNRAGSSDGLTRLDLKRSGTGKVLIKMTATGGSLVFPTLPLIQSPGSVRAMVLNEETNACWSASFSSATGDSSDTLKWKATND